MPWYIVLQDLIGEPCLKTVSSGTITPQYSRYTLTEEIDKEDTLIAGTINYIASICCGDDAVSVPDVDEVKSQANGPLDSEMLSNEIEMLNFRKSRLSSSWSCRSRYIASLYRQQHR